MDVVGYSPRIAHLALDDISFIRGPTTPLKLLELAGIVYHRPGLSGGKMLFASHDVITTYYYSMIGKKERKKYERDRHNTS